MYPLAYFLLKTDLTLVWLVDVGFPSSSGSCTAMGSTGTTSTGEYSGGNGAPGPVGTAVLNFVGIVVSLSCLPSLSWTKKKMIFHKNQKADKDIQFLILYFETRQPAKLGRELWMGKTSIFLLENSSWLCQILIHPANLCLILLILLKSPSAWRPDWRVLKDSIKNCGRALLKNPPVWIDSKIAIYEIWEVYNDNRAFRKVKWLPLKQNL